MRAILIALGRLDLLHLLPALYDEALVPEEVLAEVVEVRPDAAGAAAVRRALDARLLTRIAGSGTGDPVAGEDAVIRAAVVHGAVAAIDEVIGRRRARREGLDVIGVAGILRDARDAGLIDRLVAERFRLPQDLVERIRAEEGRD